MSVNAVTSRFGLGEKPLCLFLHKALTKNKIKMQIHLREHSCLSVNTVTDGVMKFILVSKLLAEGLREVLSCLSKAKLFSNCC